jgi:hypothetical protein
MPVIVAVFVKVITSPGRNPEVIVIVAPVIVPETVKLESSVVADPP